MMLEGAGFEVIDLGTDVSPAKFVEAVREHKAEAIGLSALLTTTMPAMKETIAALQEAGLRDRVSVMVGGAPLTQAYADGSVPMATRRMPPAPSIRPSSCSASPPEHAFGARRFGRARTFAIPASLNAPRLRAGDEAWPLAVHDGGAARPEGVCSAGPRPFFWESELRAASLSEGVAVARAAGAGSRKAAMELRSPCPLSTPRRIRARWSRLLTPCATAVRPGR